PWGLAEVLEEISIKQRANDEREFATIVQLLRNEDGETMVRISYSTANAVRRGPVTLRVSDLARLRKALVKAPRISAAIQGDRIDEERSVVTRSRSPPRARPSQS